MSEQQIRDGFEQLEGALAPPLDAQGRVDRLVRSRRRRRRTGLAVGAVAGVAALGAVVLVGLGGEDGDGTPVAVDPPATGLVMERPDGTTVRFDDIEVSCSPPTVQGDTRPLEDAKPGTIWASSPIVLDGPLGEDEPDLVQPFVMIEGDLAKLQGEPTFELPIDGPGSSETYPLTLFVADPVGGTGAAAPALRVSGLRYRYPSVASYSIEGLSHAGDALTISWLPLVGLSGDDGRRDVADQVPRDALDGIDLTVGPGEVVAVVGASGAGKSTLATLVAGLVEPDEGVLEVRGRPLGALDEQERAALVAYIPQDPYVLHASVRENLRYARADATDDELLEVCERVALDDLVRGLDDGLDTVIGEKGHRLSGGERRRLALARAALKRPALVVLDEPTAHLDTATESRVRAAMTGLFGDAGVLMIAHRLSTVRDADRIVVLDGGRVVQQGTHDELAAAPGGRYRSLRDAGAVTPG